MSINVPRFFAEKTHIAWVALLATLVWGTVAFLRMPQRKDPEIIIKTAVIRTAWPGASATDVEQLVTRPLEQLAAQVTGVDKVTSTSRTGLSVVFVTLEDTTSQDDIEQIWDDLRGRLENVRALPAGATPPQLDSHFGDTATVVYSVASPPMDGVQLDLRATAIRQSIERYRATLPEPARAGRTAQIFAFPAGVGRSTIETAAERYRAIGRELGAFADAAVLWGGSFVALDFVAADEGRLDALDERFRAEVIGGELPHPDVFAPVRVHDPGEIRGALAAAAPDRLTYRQLDDLTTQVRDEIARLPGVGRVDRHGVLPEKVYLLYSQERLAALSLHPRQITDALRGHNVTVPGGAVTTGRQTVLLDPSGAYSGIEEILDTVVANTRDGRPVYARDVLEVHRTYETPAADTSWLVWKDGDGAWHRTRSIAVAVQARPGVQVTALGAQLDQLMEDLRARLPGDLVVARTADQPELVRDKIGEFTRSLAEAIAIVMAIALLLMERRSAAVVVVSIPLTLAMTFGLMDLFGVDLQQVSIAALIIALGLLVDDPVIAADAINREIAHGASRRAGSWKGPTRLAKAILFATITNTVAFAPLLLITGTMGDFIYSLPMVVVLSLVSSRIVSMTFIPLLGQYLLKGQRGFEAALEGAGLGARLARAYNRATEWTLRHKWKSLAFFGVFAVVGLLPAFAIRTHFFPEESLSRFYVHVRLPEGSDVRVTGAVVEDARRVVLETEGDGIERMTMFVGNGGPRWWSNVSPEPRNPAYALMIVEVQDDATSGAMAGRLQAALTGRVPGARFEVYRLSSGAPATIPVEVRISGPDIPTLRRLAEEAKALLREVPATGDVTDDWGADAVKIDLAVDPARANRAGLTHQDIALSSQLAFTGLLATQLREADRLVDVVLRLRPAERATAASVRDLTVWSSRTGRPVALEQVGALGPGAEPQKIVRYEQERTLTVGAIPRPGELPSVLLADARKRLERLALPPGYAVEYGGEHEQQAKAFASVKIALQVSVALIFLVLVWQFSNVFKPLIVFAAIPFGMVGAVLGLVVTGTHFGFMAFLGVASLIGVIVSHIIVLFDFIEEARAHGVPLHQAVISSGLVRLRPVLVTVLATVGGLVPLALEGGPMWQQLVYVQISGLLLATVVTLGVVPVLYVIFVESLHLIEWKPDAPEGEDGEARGAAARETATGP